MSATTLPVLIGRLVAWLRHLPSIVWRLEARLKGVRFRGAATFVGRPMLSVAPGSELLIGEGVHLNSSLRSNPLGCFQPCVLRTLAPNAVLELGSGVGLSGAVLCAGLRIRIGDGTLLGSGAMVLDNDFHARDPDGGWRNEFTSNARGVEIGRHVFVGARAIILKGVTIGDGAVIGAGAVVTKDVPAGFLAAGNPARSFPPR